MTDHDALLRAICENPREDTPRLVYADWLEENGQHERAAFIRTDVTAYALPEWDPGRAVYDFAVRQPNYQPWAEQELGPLPVGFMWAGTPPIRRGFPWSLQVIEGCDPHGRLGETVVRYPVERVEFASTPPELRKLAVAGWLSKPVALRFSGGNFGAPALTAFLNTPALRNLTELLFWGAAITPEGVGALVESAVFPQLLSLALVSHQPQVALSFLAVVERRMEETCLRSLDLRSAMLGSDGLELLARGALLERIRRLELANTHLNAGRIEVLVSAPRITNLMVLLMSGNPLGNAGAAAVFTSPHLAGLKVLDLSYCQVGDDALRALLENSPLVDGLNLLNLTGSPASGEMKQAVKDRMGNRVRL